MLLQVPDGRFKELDAVTEVADPAVAEIAEQATNLARFMVMINEELSPVAVHSAADGADALLPDEHLAVVVS
jgi:hypothetical protein